ncbi:hypothetical protein FYK55_28255 [Roseiconus nitratireducens]|uniref:Uncharacterized protein n=1 Tax=Roseiconus nitratireducens TaxID=2605748 RepID=A0A5M6CNX7_9BACT|nr:hypothetical protein [Roseiconus nitratireducens]KAA5536090.1 hypothetical protein FYK55_28255 [Roseiconus nitratireducens]
MQFLPLPCFTTASRSCPEIPGHLACVYSGYFAALQSDGYTVRFGYGHLRIMVPSMMSRYHTFRLKMETHTVLHKPGNNAVNRRMEFGILKMVNQSSVLGGG